MKNKPQIAIVLFILSLVAFAAYGFTKEYSFFIGAIALMLVGVGLTPRKK